ncbi:MAG: response regulator [Chlamydiota bacterium]
MKTIGVIDDDKDCGVYLTFLLEENFNVAYFQSWKEGKTAFLQSSPDLILLDISMPEIKGEEVLKQIRDISTLATIPVIALTAFALPEDEERFIKLGFDGYIAKPIMDSSELLKFFNKHSLEFSNE